MSSEEKAFFRQFGERITALRIERGLTQTQIAEVLGCSQPQVFAFEKGRRRMPLSALPTLAETLGVSIEELLGISAKPTKRGPPSKLERQLQQVSELSKKKQQFVAEMLDAILLQAQQA